MAEKTKQQIVSELQTLAEREREKPIEVLLADPGPYKFPQCTVLSAYIRDQRTFEIELETEQRQRVRIPISGESLTKLKMLVDHLDSIRIR